MVNSENLNFPTELFSDEKSNIIVDKQNPHDIDKEHYEEEYRPTKQEIHNLGGNAD